MSSDQHIGSAKMSDACRCFGGNGSGDSELNLTDGFVYPSVFHGCERRLGRELGVNQIRDLWTELLECFSITDKGEDRDTGGVCRVRLELCRGSAFRLVVGEDCGRNQRERQ